MTDSDFTIVTEIAGTQVSSEQVERLYHRYYWAGQYCQNKDVLEIACGGGIGLGYLGAIAKSIHAGDIDPQLVAKTKEHYGDRFNIQVMDAQSLPFDENSMDVILIFEAIYYLPDVGKFLTECRRVLRDKGTLLIVTTNKDRLDFNPSPFSQHYYGNVELAQLAQNYGFSETIFGYWPVQGVSFLQKILRPVKATVVKLGLMPKTMAGKKFLKRLVFGKLVEMPAEIGPDEMQFTPPQIIDTVRPNTDHTVIYCAAEVKS